MALPIGQTDIIKQQMNREVSSRRGGSSEGEDSMQKIRVADLMHRENVGGGPRPRSGLQSRDVEASRAEHLYYAPVVHVLLSRPAPCIEGLAVDVRAPEQPAECLV